MFDIQTIFNYFTSSFLVATFVWFAIVGYLAHTCVLMLLAKLPFRTIYQSLLRFHAICLAISYTCTPVVTGLVGILMQWFGDAMSVQLQNQVMFVYFAWLFYWSSTIFLCSFFKESSCNKFKQALLIADSLIAVLGYFVLLLVQQNFSIIW